MEELKTIKKGLVLSSKKGLKNRHVDGLPLVPTRMQIYINHKGKEYSEFCEWVPSNPMDRKGDGPSKGFLGSARLIRKNNHGVTYHAWEGTNKEFVYYSIEKNK